MNKVTDRDPGLQPERTTLSWGRTVLLIGLNILLLCRAAFMDKTNFALVVVCFSTIFFVMALCLYSFRWQKLITVKSNEVRALDDFLAKFFVLVVLGLVVLTLCVVVAGARNL